MNKYNNSIQVQFNPNQDYVRAENTARRPINL